MTHHSAAPAAEKPLCKVNGRIAPRAMCGAIIVGLKYCGYSGACDHKQEAAPAEPVQADNTEST